MSISKAISEFVAETRYEDLSSDVTDLAHVALIDALACAFGGKASDLGERGFRVVRSLGGAPQAQVVGSDLRLPMPSAAFLNAHFANMLDYDDTYVDLGHPGTTVIPAALAVGEHVGATGKDVLAAMVLGYEVSMRLAWATRPTDERFREIYPVGWQAWGPMIAAAKLLGFDAAHIRHAMGIVNELAPNGTVLTTETTFGFKAGKMGQFAQTGVMAALLAREGFEGKQTSIDPETPFWLAWGTDRYRKEALTDGLGDDFVFLDLSFKPYPSCRMTHTAADAAVQMAARLKERGVSIDDVLDRRGVRSVRLETYTRTLQLKDSRPMHMAHGPFCMPYVVTMALAGVPAGPDWYSDAALADERMLRASDAVELVAIDEFDRIVDETGRMPARLTVELVDGETLQTYVDEPLGDPSRPLGKEVAQAKLTALAEPILGAEGAEALLKALSEFAEAPTAAEVMGLAAAPA